jgi:hypothetical protein
MGIFDKFLKAEQKIRGRIESAFGDNAAKSPLEIRRAILEQVESRIIVDRGGKSFPFGKVIIQLIPATAAQRDVFEAAFIRNGSMKADVRQTLLSEQAKFPDDFQVVIKIEESAENPQPESAAQAPFTIDFVLPENSKKAVVPDTKLTIIKGVAEQPVYEIRKERILVGRLPEVLDREGRMIRKNDVIFLDNGDDVNSTVGRIQARIWFDGEKNEFRIMDEASRYGTRIIREGRSIEVPGGNTRGVRLHSGDEIYLGQACLRFESATQAKTPEDSAALE